MPALRRTPLYERHLAAGAKLVDFAGWEMPVEYPTGLRTEHMAVREGCGIFDVSHMGRLDTSGPGAERFLQRMLSNDVSAIAPGGAQYSLLCREDGGVLDDLFAYRFGEGDSTVWLTVTNAANHEADKRWLQSHADGFDVDITDVSAKWAMLALQGPQARAVLARHLQGVSPPRMRAMLTRVAGVQCVIAGTGYTGEDGVELLVPSEEAIAVWDALVGAGATPAGLGARDTLRLEACFHLYGNDLTSERNPIEAGLGWCCVESTGFIGSEPIAAARSNGPAERLVAFAIEGRGIARAGNQVIGGGVVTSGTLSPTLGIGVGLAYVPAGRATVGASMQIDVRGKLRDAVIQSKPLVKKHG
ncbi:MAG: glycine cleavage system aminomethyltransferase GcvT [Solirubrobacteraceae bacterium]